MKIKTNDNVKILAGKDRGKTGKVIQVFADETRVVVEGVNKLIKNVKARSKEEKGQQIPFFAPMAASNVQVICPKCKKAARLRKKILENGKRVRVCAKCNEQLE